MFNQLLRRVALRTLLLLASILAVTQAASAGFPSTLYFDFSNISNLSSYTYKTVHFYDGGSNSNEITLQAVTGSSTCYYIDNAETGAGTCEIFLGTSSSSKTKMYGISAPTDGSNMIVVSSWDNSSGSEFSGSGNYNWSTYSSGGSSSISDVKIIGEIGASGWTASTDGVSMTSAGNGIFTCTVSVTGTSGTKYFAFYTNENKFLIPNGTRQVTGGYRINRLIHEAMMIHSTIISVYQRHIQ